MRDEGKKRVFLVDANQSARRLIRSFLVEKQADRMELFEFDTGRQILDFCEKYQPHAIILDGRLNEVDALQIIGQVRSQNRHKRLPAFVLLLHQGSEDRVAEVMQAGADDYIVKDEIDRVALNHVITSAIERATLLDRLDRKHQELLDKNEELKRASDIKSDFLANMSHEIRTPMNGVIGMTSILMHTELTQEQSECVETIRNSGEVLLALINDILDFSKVEAGKIELEVIDFRPRNLVEDAIDLYSEKAYAKGILFTNIIDPKIPSLLLGDPTRIRQVLANFISNALKFTDSGEVILSMDLISETQSDVCIRCEVSDTGIGIADDSIAQIFDSFSQADRSTTRTYGGTGLGLAISKKLIHLMNGKIGVESTIGKGSCFFFELNLKKLEGDAFESERFDATKKRILIVSENPWLRRRLEQQLSLRGFEVTSLDCGSLALSWLIDQKRPFQAVILDSELGDIEQKDFLATLDQTFSDSFPCICLNGRTGTKGQGRISLRKPIRQSQLYSVIIDLLSSEVTHSRTGKEGNSPNSAQGRSRAENSGRILVVEDNVINQRVVVRMLEKLGWECDVVANGVEAVSAIKRLPYSLVFMDCQMPEMDGYEATKRIRSMEAEGQSTPIVAMTANALKGDREKCLSSGMNDYLPKPVMLEGICKVLKKWTKQSTTVGVSQINESSSSLLLDRDTLLELESLSKSGQESLLEELIGIFEEVTPPVINRLELALKEQNPVKVKRLAHKLKGSCANLGARSIVSACMKIEQLAKDGKLEGIGPLVREISNDYEKVQAELNADWRKTG